MNMPLVACKLALGTAVDQYVMYAILGDTYKVTTNQYITMPCACLMLHSS